MATETAPTEKPQLPPNKTFTLTDNGDGTVTFSRGDVKDLFTIASVRLTSLNPNIIAVASMPANPANDTTKTLRVIATGAVDLKATVAYHSNAQSAEFMIPCNVGSDNRGGNVLTIGEPWPLSGTDATITFVSAQDKANSPVPDPTLKESLMPTKSIPVIKKPASSFKSFIAGLKKHTAGTPLKSAGVVVPDQLPDDGTVPFTVVLLDAAGNSLAFPTDGSVTLTAVSDTPSVCTVDTVVGASSTVRAAVSPAPVVGATANINLTATWTANPPAGSPFTLAWPQTIIASPVAGIGVNPGTPTG